MKAQLPLILTVADLAYSGDEDVVKLMGLMLDREGPKADLQVVPVTEVVEAARDLNPALIIVGHRPLSAESPDVWGTSIIKALKADPQTRRIPVLLLEALWNIEQVAQECGADAYLNLPTSSKEFVDTISRLIDAKGE